MSINVVFFLQFAFNLCSSGCVLNDDQSLWIEDTAKLVYQVSLNLTCHWEEVCATY